MSEKLRLVAVVFLLNPVIAFGQLRPDDAPPTVAGSKPAFDKLLLNRDSLVIPANLESLTQSIADIDELLEMARQLQIAEGDSSPGKRYGLLVEGFDRLKQKIGRIPFLVEQKEFALAAGTIEEVALINQLWSGQPDAALGDWANGYREKASEQDKPVQPLFEKLNREWNSGDLTSGRATLTQLLNRKMEIYGDTHTEVMETLVALWEIHFESGSLREGISFLARAVPIAGKVYGEQHWQTVDLRERLKFTEQLVDSEPEIQTRIFYLWRNSLRLNDVPTENIEKTLAFIDREIKFAEETLGFESSLVAQSYIQFAGLAKNFGQLSYSVAFYLRGTSTAQKIFGDLHPLTCSAVCGWSVTCRRMNDNERAFELADKAVEMNRKLYGEGSQEYIRALSTFGVFYYEFESYPQALYVLNKVKRLRTLLNDDQSVVHAMTLHHLGMVHKKLGNFEAARGEFESAMKMINENDEPYINVAGSLLEFEMAEGNIDESLEKASQIVDLARKKYGSDNIRFAYTLENLATTQVLAGRESDAARTLEKSLAITRRHLNRLGKTQGRRLRTDAYTVERNGLFHYLTIATELGDMDQLAYEHVAVWKAAVIRQGRVLAQTKGIKSEVIFDQKRQTIADAISNYLSVVDTQSGDSVKLDTLNEMIQAWEDVHRNSIFKEEFEYQKSTLEEIQAKLPDDAVLIDFFEYTHMIPRIEFTGERFETTEQVLAFVFRRNGPVKMIQVGKVEDIEKIIFRWREEISRNSTGAQTKSGQTSTADFEFYQKVWKPIADVIGNAKQVIICPDGMLSLVPWASVPINEDRRYLIEDCIVSTVPYVDILATATSPVDRSKQPVMTLAGNLDYRQPMSGRSEGRIFNSLPGTTREIGAVKSLFDEKFPMGRLTFLDQRKGTELNVRNNAMRSNYLHVATHGFFAQDIWNAHQVNEEKAAFRQRIRVMVPEAMSALVLSGANQGMSAADAVQPKSFGMDGILTGLEVISMDLRSLDLVTLSACQTSIGTVSSGTGKLGLEQAFLAAGANSVLSTLWQVDDAATATLMVEFYRNLWSNGMSKGEALREAQLSLLNRYDPTTNQLRPRGLKLLNQPKAEISSGRLPPYYWAPLTLSGNWN